MRGRDENLGIYPLHDQTVYETTCYVDRAVTKIAPDAIYFDSLEDCLADIIVRILSCSVFKVELCRYVDVGNRETNRRTIFLNNFLFPSVRTM